MPRAKRQESQTGYYHVMIRGINRIYLFEKDVEKDYFLKQVKNQINEGDFEIAVWCLMDNHVHFVLKANLEKMSKAIKVISLKYAAYYNKRYKRVGPVFGDRYKSEVIENDTYLLEVMRYIHNNPLKAKITDNLNDYRWSSYKEYFNESNYINETQRQFVCAYFENKQRKFEAFHEIEDDNEYLEIKEDAEKQRLEKAQNRIVNYCHRNGVIDSRSFKRNRGMMDELINELLRTKLPMRKIAELLGVSVGRVYQSSKE